MGSVALTEPVDLKAFQSYISKRDEQCLVQLFYSFIFWFYASITKLVVHDFITEEARIKSHAEKGSKSTTTPTVFVVPKIP